VSDAIHEASHLAVAEGFHWQLRGASIAGGRRMAGCARFDVPPVPRAAAADARAALRANMPVLCWPAPVRAVIEQLLTITLAGDEGELALAGPEPGAARTGEPVRERAASLVEQMGLPEPTPGDLAAFETIMDSPDTVSDDEETARLARAACGADAASASALIAFCAAQARSMVGAGAEAIRLLARELELREVLSGEAALAVLRSVQGPGVD
jgi:hypothetical protein